MPVRTSTCPFGTIGGGETLEVRFLLLLLSLRPPMMGTWGTGDPGHPYSSSCLAGRFTTSPFRFLCVSCGNHENRVTCGACLPHAHTVLRFKRAGSTDEYTKPSISHRATRLLYDTRGRKQNVHDIDGRKGTGLLYWKEHFSALTNAPNQVTSVDKQDVA